MNDNGEAFPRALAGKGNNAVDHLVELEITVVVRDDDVGRSLGVEDSDVKFLREC